MVGSELGPARLADASGVPEHGSGDSAQAVDDPGGHVNPSLGAKPAKGGERPAQGLQRLTALRAHGRVPLDPPPPDRTELPIEVVGGVRAREPMVAQEARSGEYQSSHPDPASR